MCMSSPKMPKAPAVSAPPPPQAPSAPPPPTKTATKVGNKALKNRNSSKKRGTSALTVRRSTVNTGSSGSGANINY